MFTAGRTHHEFLLIEVGGNAQSVTSVPRVGMYHFGLKIGTSDEELKAAIQQIKEVQIPIVGISDHGVTHSLYITDPDGNKVELYIDVQPKIWRVSPSEMLAPTRPLML
jgi:catechol 2,3-dioxygenase